MALFGLFRRRPLRRAGFALYTSAVTAARDPALFATLAVPDDLEGRFDMVSLLVALLVRRLRTDPDPRGAEAAQEVFDAMFADMDINLREMGVSDLRVGRRVKSLWEAFHGRARAYEDAVDATDAGALAAALTRNLWRAGEEAHPGAPVLAAAALRVAAALATLPLGALLDGTAAFPAVVLDGAEGARAA